MRQLEAFLGSQKVGDLAELGRGDIVFEYVEAYLENGLSLSPYLLPLRRGIQRPESRAFGGLFGVFDDSIPDGWGLLLMDRELRRRGIDPGAISPLDRLSYVGSRGLGALAYRPPAGPADNEVARFDLSELAAQAERIAQGSPERALPALLKLGGSPAGARPKIVVAFNPATGKLAADPPSLPPGFERWIVKFRAKIDEPDAGPVEQAYHQMAARAGIEVPPSTLLPTKQGVFFASRRFDRDLQDARIHTHSFGGLVGADFRLPDRDYRELLEVTFDLTQDSLQLEQAFRRMAFNVLAHNRDDHVKNFAFQLLGSTWRLSPAYDLTYSDGIGGQHNMTVLGQGRPAWDDCLALARVASLPRARARSILNEVREALSAWKPLARAAGVTAARMRHIASALAGADI